MVMAGMMMGAGYEHYAPVLDEDEPEAPKLKSFDEMEKLEEPSKPFHNPPKLSRKQRKKRKK